MIRRRFHKLFFIGLWFLAAANLWHWLMRSSTLLSEDWVDGIHGLFIGISIGCLLFGISKSRRTNCGPTHT